MDSASLWHHGPSRTAICPRSWRTCASFFCGVLLECCFGGKARCLGSGQPRAVCIGCSDWRAYSVVFTFSSKIGVLLLQDRGLMSWPMSYPLPRSDIHIKTCEMPYPTSYKKVIHLNINMTLRTFNCQRWRPQAQSRICNGDCQHDLGSEESTALSSGIQCDGSGDLRRTCRKHFRSPCVCQTW